MVRCWSVVTALQVLQGFHIHERGEGGLWPQPKRGYTQTQTVAVTCNTVTLGGDFFEDSETAEAGLGSSPPAGYRIPDTDFLV